MIILDLLSALDRRVLGSMIATVSIIAGVLAWVQSSASAAAGATALLLPAAALGVIAVVVQPVRLIVAALVLGAGLLIGGLFVGF